VSNIDFAARRCASAAHPEPPVARAALAAARVRWNVARVAPIIALVLALVGSGAAAQHADARPTNLNDFAESAQSSSSTHFKVHYDPTDTSPGRVDEILNDLETDYSRLVAGEDGTPNLGMRAPVSDANNQGSSVRDEDADGLTDVYMLDTLGGGGVANCDGGEDVNRNSGWVWMDPDLSPGSLRFRISHEMVHVIQCAYASHYVAYLSEAEHSCICAVQDQRHVQVSSSWGRG